LNYFQPTEIWFTKTAEIAVTNPKHSYRLVNFNFLLIILSMHSIEARACKMSSTDIDHPQACPIVAM
jgi:hypothetical protein